MTETVAPVTLHAFAYGEYLEGQSRRSLGFRMLTPSGAEPWAAEVETLARRLQSAPYPDHWPTSELFCSVILAHGQRLIAAARYGLVDHTVSQRRGGLELFGVIGPNTVSVNTALTVYAWLRHRRESGELREMGGELDLGHILSEAPSPPPEPETLPVLPIRLWQEGALIFAANTPTDPDRRLAMLEQTEGGDWQWLPLVGADFPVTVYAERGPVVAWTPHIANVALKLNQSSIVNGPIVATTPPQNRVWLYALLGGTLALGAANLWATLRATERIGVRPAEPIVTVSTPTPEPLPVPPQPAENDPFARQLVRHLLEQGWLREADFETLIRQYDRMTLSDESLKANTREEKIVIGFLGRAEQRSPAQIRDVIREVGNREFNPQVIDVLAKMVFDRLSE